MGSCGQQGKEKSEDPAPSVKVAKTTEEPKEVQVLHIIRKHRESRRPASWRDPKITCSKEQAKAKVQAFHDELAQIPVTNGVFGKLRKRFMEIAQKESDCNSAKQGGDLGMFEKGRCNRRSARRRSPS